MIAAACRKPSDFQLPVTHWSAALLGVHLAADGVVISSRSISRILSDADLQPHRQTMWLTSHDDEFRTKRDDVLDVYYRAPAHEHVICLDEMTGLQALERARPDLAMTAGRPERRDFEYIRHGTLCFMGAYDVRQGKLFGEFTEGHNSETFVDLLDYVEALYPEGRGHLICDNLSAHDTDDVWDWLEDHPRWTLHFTPKHASWLNQIECAFGQIQRWVVRRGSFRSKEELKAAIEAYLDWRNRTSQPFVWTYQPKSWQAKSLATSGERH